MKNVVTFGTAAKLKAAGFPQPEPLPLMHWVVDDSLCIVTEINSDGSVRFLGQVDEGIRIATRFFTKMLDNDCVFAPTAEELLNALPPCYAATLPEEKWEVRATKDGQFWAASHESLAEAAAECWLLAKS